MITTLKTKGGVMMLILYLGAFTCAGILFSQSRSFADPPKDHEHYHYLSQHAELLSFAGAGIGFLAILAFRLVAKVASLEAALVEAKNGFTPEA